MPTSPPDATVPTIRTLDEWEAYKPTQATEAVLLQCGSPVCTRCPAFTETIDRLKPEWKFVHVYVNTHDADEDLLEELQVTKLPAYRLLPVGRGEPHHGQNSTPQDVEIAIRTLCAPVLKLDEDF